MPEAALVLEGTVHAAPSEATELVLQWTGAASDVGEAGYLHGRDELHEGGYRLALQALPEAALDEWGVGVGRPMLAPAGAIVDGLQGDDRAWRIATGIAPRHVVVYVDRARAEAALQDLGTEGSAEQVEAAKAHWIWQFPEGYACGEAREPAGTDAFDNFVPVDCSTIAVRVGDPTSFDLAQWR